MTHNVRKGMPDPHLDKETFRTRFLHRYYDPQFAPCKSDLEALVDIAWDAYERSRKAPRTRKAGDRFEDPNYDLSEEWFATHEAIAAAGSRQADPAAPSRVLLIQASPRSEHTCPGEMPKTYRLADAHTHRLKMSPAARESQKFVGFDLWWNDRIPACQQG